jgi:hypothetical protein
MTTEGTSLSTGREPELLGQTVVVIGRNPERLADAAGEVGARRRCGRRERSRCAGALSASLLGDGLEAPARYSAQRCPPAGSWAHRASPRWRCTA